jgi:hypothetical protein
MIYDDDCRVNGYFATTVAIDGEQSWKLATRGRLRVIGYVCGQ